jgi:hypothetical protein
LNVVFGAPNLSILSPLSSSRNTRFLLRLTFRKYSSKFGRQPNWCGVWKNGDSPAKMLVAADALDRWSTPFRVNRRGRIGEDSSAKIAGRELSL